MSVALAALACATGSASAAGWTNPSPVSAPGNYGQASQDAAANSAGDAIAAWSDVEDRLGYARRTGSGEFGLPQTPTGQGDSVRVAINANGDAAMVWRASFGVTGLVLPRSGAPIPFTVKSGTEESTSGMVAVGVDSSGAVTAFWNDSHHVWWATRPAGGSFGTPRSIANPGRYADAMRATVAANGAKIVGWKDYDGIYAAYAPPGSSTFAVTTLDSDVDQSALLYDTRLGVSNWVFVATNATGDAAVSWLQCWDGCSDYDVIATTKPAGGSFRVPQTLQGMSPLGFRTPVGMDASGNATVAWAGGGGPSRIEGVWASRSSNGVFEPAQLVSSDAGCEPDVAAAPDGTSYLVWNEYEGASRGCQGDIGYEMASSRGAGAAGFDQPSILSDNAPAELPPRVVARGTSGAMAVWPEGVQAPDYHLQLESSDTTTEPQPPPSTDPAGTYTPPQDTPAQDSQANNDLGGPITQPATAAAQLRVSVTVPHRPHIRALVKQGLTLLVTSSAPVRLSTSLVSRRGRKPLGTATHAAPAGRSHMRIRMTRAARRVLRHADRMRIALSISATGTDGQTIHLTRRLVAVSRSSR